MPVLVTGSVQKYAWGDTSFIPSLLGLPVDGSPHAEWWLGTHPVAPSVVVGTGAPLESVTGPMRMLVKVLSCAQPLSLQTHPTTAQARAGFAREESAGMAADDPRRNYRDDSAKPEMLIALTEFEALCGFDDIDSNVEQLKSYGWNEEAEVLDMNGTDGYVLWAFDQSDTPDMSAAPDWLRRISTVHPGDRGLRVAPLLHHVVLQPGEAVALPAGNLHAYLHGFGLEVMRSSDNVVRAGFTTKHVDVAELQRIVDTAPIDDPVVRPDADGRYGSPSPSFGVRHLRSAAGTVLEPVDDVRVVYGRLSGAHHSAVVVPAGEAMEFDGSAADVWVCTQHRD